VALFAQDSLSAARDLYASAAYEDALAVLSRLNVAGLRPDDGRTADQYRALCLLALGKTAEASLAIEAVVAGQPLYRPSDGDVSPRVRAAFSDVRRRVLPGLVQQRYAQYKVAFDRKDYQTASAGFNELLALYADPDLANAAGRPPLADLRVLIGGFYELSLQAAAPPPAPEPAPVRTATAQAPVTQIPRSGATADGRRPRNSDRRDRQRGAGGDARSGRASLRPPGRECGAELAVQARDDQRRTGEVPQDGAGGRHAPVVALRAACSSTRRDFDFRTLSSCSAQPLS
jgi:hypothetical protein